MKGEIGYVYRCSCGNVQWVEGPMLESWTCDQCKRIAELAAERDRLAAQVERLHEELSEAWGDGYAVGRLNNDNVTPHYPAERKAIFVLAAIDRAAGRGEESS